MTKIHRLPPELLSEIFLHLSPTIFSLEIPPLLTQTPWILGRICSRWRSISRKDPRLWGRPQIKLRSECVRNLQFAVNILPPAVHISIVVPFDHDVADLNPNINLKILLPYLNRCDSLRVAPKDINFFDDFWSVPVPHDAFVNLHELFIEIDRESDFHQHLDSRVNRAFPTGPLHLASQLHKVRLFSGRDINWPQIVMPIGVPWSQLTYLNIDGVSNVPDLCEILQQCDTLAELTIATESKVAQTRFDKTVYLPHLRKLCLLSNNDALWIPLHSWERLADLELHAIYPGDLLQHALQECVNLTKLTVILSPDFPLKPLSLPSLRFLNVDFSTVRPLMDCFILPRLENLDIWGSLDLAIVSDMLKNSKCSLSFLSYRGFMPMQHPTSLRNLLTSLSSSVSVEVFFHWGKFAPPILHDIGMGILLPKLKEFNCIPESVDDILDMLEKRVDREVRLRSGGLTKWRIHTSDPRLEMANERFQNLCSRAPGQVDILMEDDDHLRDINAWHITFGASEE